MITSPDHLIPGCASEAGVPALRCSSNHISKLYTMTASRPVRYTPAACPGSPGPKTAV